MLELKYYDDEPKQEEETRKGLNTSWEDFLEGTLDDPF